MTTSRTDTSQMTTDAIDSLGRFLNDTTQIGNDLLGAYTRLLTSSMSGASSTALVQSMTSAMDSLRSAVPQMQVGGGCRIPPPCWAPQPMGNVTSHVCSGLHRHLADLRNQLRLHPESDPDRRAQGIGHHGYTRDPGARSTRAGLRHAIDPGRGRSCRRFGEGIPGLGAGLQEPLSALDREGDLARRLQLP